MFVYFFDRRKTACDTELMYVEILFRFAFEYGALGFRV